MAHFTSALFSFLRELKRNNERPWFTANKARFESVVRDPALAFIADFAPHLAKVSRHFVADPRPVGGSLFRIHRDTRFSKDKTPYKTNIGLHFRHETAKNAYAPGFYLHLEPKACMVGVGIWHPDAPTQRAIREAIVERPKAWQGAVGAKAFERTFTLAGDSLKRPPPGVDKDHPLVDDLKRKDFIGIADLDDDAVVDPAFAAQLARMFKDGAPLMKFLCEAVRVPF
jgi:uncharacterized protein (TIGR02453 family)